MGSITVPAGTQDFAYLSTVTAVNDAIALIDETLDDTYDKYLVVGSAITVSNDGAQLRAQMEFNGVPAAANYRYYTEYSNSAAAVYTAQRSDAGASILMNENIGNAASEGATINIWIDSPASATLQKKIRFQGSNHDNTGVLQNIDGSGSNSEVAAMTGLRIFPSVGTLSGVFTLYGIKQR